MKVWIFINLSAVFSQVFWSCQNSQCPCVVHLSCLVLFVWKACFLHLFCFAQLFCFALLVWQVFFVQTWKGVRTNKVTTQHAALKPDITLSKTSLLVKYHCYWAIYACEISLLVRHYCLWKHHFEQNKHYCKQTLPSIKQNHMYFHSENNCKKHSTNRLAVYLEINRRNLYTKTSLKHCCWVPKWKPCSTTVLYSNKNV